MAIEGNRLIGLQDSDLKLHTEFAIEDGRGIVESVSYDAGLMKLRVPDIISQIYFMVIRIPGARVSQNLLKIGADLKMSIEYGDSNGYEISQIIDFAMSVPEESRPEVAYMGEYSGNLPILLKEYLSMPQSDDTFRFVRTVWKFTETEREKDAMGIFLNRGTLVPQSYTESTDCTIHMEIKEDAVKGNFEYQVISRDPLRISVKVKTSFFSDFYREVICNYSEPLYYNARVGSSQLTSYFLVQKEKLNQFLNGLYKHWDRPSREDHDNTVHEIRELGRVNWDDIDSGFSGNRCNTL